MVSLFDFFAIFSNPQMDHSNDFQSELHLFSCNISPSHIIDQNLVCAKFPFFFFLITLISFFLILMYRIVTIFFGFVCKCQTSCQELKRFHNGCKREKWLKQVFRVAFFSSLMVTKNYTISNGEKLPLTLYLVGYILVTIILRPTCIFSSF